MIPSISLKAAGGLNGLAKKCAEKGLNQNQSIQEMKKYFTPDSATAFLFLGFLWEERQKLSKTDNEL